jgi:hypothetical protein
MATSRKLSLVSLALGKSRSTRPRELYRAIGAHRDKDGQKPQESCAARLYEPWRRSIWMNPRPASPERIRPNSGAPHGPGAMRGGCSTRIKDADGPGAKHFG